MNVKQALLTRKSTRAFLDKKVSRDTVQSILDAARHAPSGANTQPWQVAVVMDDTKQQLQQRIEQQYRSGIKSHMDYEYYPTEWKQPYKDRRFATGMQLYQALGINKEDKQRRADQWAANYRAFDAPVMLFFFMDAGLQTGSFMDYGMFIQSVMLAAVDEGLASCPQASLGEYPDIVKDALGYSNDSILLCGMSLGYEDTDAPVNGYRTPRDDVASFTRFFD
ncbi:MAG: nitroreductase [Gammaproteobacteria bacterium]|jgi:nitroreductase